MAKQKVYKNDITDTKSVSEYLNKEYFEYAQSVVRERAIPHFCDGLKPVQRKILCSAEKVAKGKGIGVSALAATIKQSMNYRHGESSANAAVIAMCQPFMQALPMLHSDSQVGWIHEKEPGSPRYLTTTLSQWFDKVYQDSDLLDYTFDDGVKYEPVNYLPILPMLLINGTDGIAVGFATSFANRNPLEVALATKLELQGKLDAKVALTPYVGGFRGVWSWYKQGFDSVGQFKRINDTEYEIYSLPYDQSIMGQCKILQTLIDRGIIESYANYSNDDAIKYIVTCFDKNSADALEPTALFEFGLVSRLPKDNLTCIMPNGSTKRFTTPIQYIKAFVHWRLKIYEKRKQHLLRKLQFDIDKNNELIKFILLVHNKEVIFGEHKVAQIRAILKENSIGDWVLNEKISKLTLEFVDELTKLNGDLQKQLEVLQNTEPNQLYINDLDVLIKDLKKDYEIVDLVNILKEPIKRVK